ncbi:MAG TPA: hypothetical protein VIY73_12030, partial [Polyangiaceae bacterium]
APRSGAAGAAGPPTHIDAEPRIVTASEVSTVRELEERGERALMEQRWSDAADAYRTLLAGTPDGSDAAEYAFDLGLSLEGMQKRVEARDTFLDLARRFPDGPKARASLVRAASLDAYLEDWKALEGIGDTLLARRDLEDVDRIVALGSRGLARVELGEDGPAEKDVLDGLEIADRLHYGARDVLPVAVAQLRFALGEVRRVRSEKIRFDTLPADFSDKDFTDRVEERAGGLLQAQDAYAMAVRSVDPHWAAMAGTRVGEMYRALHRDLVQVPPPATVKTERQRQIFFAFMHISYRVLLEKGLRQLEQTVDLGERIADSSTWIQRARDAREEMRTALDDEKAQIAKMPFTEDEVRAAMGQLKARHAK